MEISQLKFSRVTEHPQQEQSVACEGCQALVDFVSSVTIAQQNHLLNFSWGFDKNYFYNDGG